MKGKKLSPKELRAKLESDKQTRIKTFNEIIAHVSSGLSLDCYPPLSDDSIREYCKKFPDEFDTDKLSSAIRAGKDYWENLGKAQADGRCMGNSRTWYYNMSNRYGWRDKIDTKVEHDGNVNVNVVSYASSKPSHTS